MAAAARSRKPSVLMTVSLGLLVVVHAGVAAAVRPAPNIRSVRWNEVSVPGSVCGAGHPISLRDGYAVVASSRWPDAAPRVSVYREEHVAYGDLDGDARDEAGLGIVCANGGGTAAGQLAFAQVIFRLKGTALQVIGIVTPRRSIDRSARHVPLVTVQIVLRRIIATEYFYGPNDGDCCASGRARTIWHYVEGSLKPGEPFVTRRATQ